MKRLINLVVLFLLSGASAFAAIPAKFKNHNVKLNDKVSFIPLQLKTGFAVRVDKQEPGKSMVIIYDSNQNVILKNVLTKETTGEKKYILSLLDDGDYTVEVYSKNYDVKTQFSVYTKGERKIAHLN